MSKYQNIKETNQMTRIMITFITIWNIRRWYRSFHHFFWGLVSVFVSVVIAVMVVSRTLDNSINWCVHWDLLIAWIMFGNNWFNLLLVHIQEEGAIIRGWDGLRGIFVKIVLLLHINKIRWLTCVLIIALIRSLFYAFVFPSTNYMHFKLIKTTFIKIMVLSWKNSCETPIIVEYHKFIIVHIVIVIFGMWYCSKYNN